MKPSPTPSIAVPNAELGPQTALPTDIPVPTPVPTPAPPDWTARQFPLPGFPAALALDSTAIFALYTPASFDPHDDSHMTLARIDRKTAKVITNGPFPGGRQLLRVNAGLWVLGGLYTGSLTDRFWMDRLDPTTLAIRARQWVPAQSSPNRPIFPELTATANTLWLSYGSRAYRLNPVTGNVLFSRSFAGVIMGISIDPAAQHLYIGLDPTGGDAGADLLVQLNPLTAAPLASSPTGGQGLGGPTVTASNDGVWVSYATGMMAAVEHHSSEGLSPLPVFQGPAGSNGLRLFVGPTSVWLTDEGSQRVSCIDPQTETLLSSTMQGPGALVADQTSVYVATQSGIALLRPDSSCFA